MRLIHRSALFIVSSIALTLVSASQTWANEDKSRPNIVLIFADDMGINDLGCYGRKEHHTPNLDRLAAQGMRFTNAYAAQSICSPSRAAIMTGLHPARLNLTHYLPGRPDTRTQILLQPLIEGQLPLEEVTIAEILREAGYATGLFGKWHLGGKGFGPAEQGFEVVFEPQATTEPTPDVGGKGEYLITDAAIRFIEDHRDRPFFCYIPHNNPHIPLSAIPELVEKNRDAFHPTYAAMMETLDDSIGRLLATLDRLELAKRTIVLFTSDNGGLHVLESNGTPATHNTPFRAGKGYIYEGGHLEPLIIRWPDVIAAGSLCETPVVLTDCVPTLIEAARLVPEKVVGPLDGVSWMPLFRGQSIAERDLYWHFPHYSNQGGRPAGAIRRGDWKLIEQYEDGSVELYHLVDDPGESRNRAADEPELAESLLADLRAWRTRVGARMPRPNPAVDREAHARLYLDPDPSRLVPKSTAAETLPAWTDWRSRMQEATEGCKPKVIPPTGDVRLFAQDARIHGRTLRYEPAPGKRTLGFWMNPDDWAEWSLEIPATGTYEVEVQQGCGKGSGGSEVELAIGGHTLPFRVVETGHFQSMVLLRLGTVPLEAGPQTLTVRVKSKPAAAPAVMDLRRVVLRPAE